MSADYETLLASVTRRCAAVGQSHVLAHLSDDSIPADAKLSFLRSVDAVPLETLAACLQGALAEEEQLRRGGEGDDVIEPFAGDAASTTTSDPAQLAALAEARAMGVQAVADGAVAAVLLAGGQGTRLGYDGPKGMYDIGLASKRTLFQFMVERLKELGRESGRGERAVPFYIMTSPLNHAATTAYFARHDDFGLDVRFFPQGTLPALTPAGRMILETPTSLAVAPDGNGGLYPALVRHGILEDMASRGVRYLHVFGVDNALVRPADPAFVGYCLRQRADCGNKVLWKTSPGEKVGVVATKGGKPCIVEYSDISEEMTRRKGDDGRLAFGAGNICQHFYTLDFMTQTIVPNLGNVYHIAHKKIPYYDDDRQETVKPAANNGIKLESFIFDVFPLSQRMAVLDVARAEEFAPVKNPPGTATDSPDSARALFRNVAWAREEEERALRRA